MGRPLIFGKQHPAGGDCTEPPAAREGRGRRRIEATYRPAGRNVVFLRPRRPPWAALLCTSFSRSSFPGSRLGTHWLAGSAGPTRGRAWVTRAFSERQAVYSSGLGARLTNHHQASGMSLVIAEFSRFLAAGGCPASHVLLPRNPPQSSTLRCFARTVKDSRVVLGGDPSGMSLVIAEFSRFLAAGGCPASHVLLASGTNSSPCLFRAKPIRTV